ncbi:MAG: 5'-3' exonuclease [Candidatus Nanopelagicales bacterium]|jgi:5'-3' exonuclease|nr:5'-3' exonuclease [Candidatus Nanopelagicales bacterium]
MRMLLDSAGLYFRAFHAIPESVTAPDGLPVNAVRGFLDMTAALVVARRPTHLVACWDEDWRPGWRVDLLPTYKAHRVADDGGEDEPASLAAQVAVIVDVLEAVGIPRAGVAGYEADDVIGTLARRHGARGEAVEVVTGDRDLIQLVDDAASIRVLYTGKGIRRLEVLDDRAVKAAYGVSPAQYADLAILRGDPSDGLPGIPGVGARTAAGLLTRFGDLAALRAVLADGDAGIRPGIAAALRSADDYLVRAEAVVRVADVPLPEVDGRLPATPQDPDRLAALAQRWNLESPTARLVDALAQVADGG